MKKIIVCLLCMVILSGCDPKPFTGYVVCKEYTPGHMEDKKVNTIQEAIIVPVHPRVYKSKPKWIKPEWVVYVANKDRVRSFRVDSATFARLRLGQKITLNR